MFSVGTSFGVMLDVLILNQLVRARLRSKVNCFIQTGILILYVIIEEIA